jgi:release factor glutamine methyltransferase
LSDAPDGRIRIGAARRALTRRLAASLSPSQAAGAPLDARLIFASALGVDPAELPFRDEEFLPAARAETVERLAARRLAGEPAARIFGHRQFWGLDLALSPGTLEPRPDTETLVELALAQTADRNAPLRLLDLGTGSGAILLALLSELPNAWGLGVDLSEDALHTARSNAGRLGLAARASWLGGRWNDSLGGAFNLVVSNPPYVETGAIAGLEPEVRLFDPHLALDGGPDGLDAYRDILAGLDQMLSGKGTALLEIGHEQAASVIGIAEKQGFSASVHQDLGGRDRVVRVWRGR